MTLVLIWRGVQISSPILESCPNQLSNFGELSKSVLVTIRLLKDSWQTPDIFLTDSQQTSNRLTLNPRADSKKFVGDDTRSQYGELSKSALQIWRAFQISSPNLVTIRLLTDYWQTPDILLTDSQQTSDRLTLNPTVDPKKFVGNDSRSQFGELSKSALQIWRTFQISSPNLVPIRLLTDSWQTPDRPWQTLDRFLTDSQQAPKRLTLNAL